MRARRALIRLRGVFGCTVRARVNRFVVETITRRGELLLAHTNNTGRLLDYLAPGRTVYCYPISGRRLKTRIAAARDGSSASLIDTALQMRAFEEAVAERLLPWLTGCGIVKRSPRLDDSRLDYLLDCGGPVYVEVKSAAMRVGEAAAYPDCPTERGRRHIRLLAEHAASGGRAMIVFVASVPGARFFAPYEPGDPEIPGLLREARSSGVSVKAFSIVFDPASGSVLLENPDLPVRL